MGRIGNGWALAAGAAAFLMAVYLPGLGDECGLTQKDEFTLSMRTQIEMIERGQFLTPYLDGEPRLKKPPLVYWAMAGLGMLFGTGLFVARLPGVLAAGALAGATMMLAREVSDRRGREACAGALLLTCMGVYILGRMALLDVPLAAFVAWGVVGFVRWVRGGATGWLMVSAASAGLANMTKGPLGPLFVLLIAAAHVWVFREWGAVRAGGRAWAAALVLFLVVALLWPAAMAVQWGGTFWKTLWSELLAKRFAAGGEGPLTVLGGFLGLVMPWAFVLAAAAATAVARRRDGGGRQDLWLIGWILACTVPFLLLRSKFERYMVPAIPAAVLLVVRRFEGGTRWGRAALWITASVLGAGGACVAAAGIWFRVGPWPLWVLSAAVGLLAGYVLAARRDLTLGAVLAGVALLVSAGVMYPYLGVNRLPAGVAEGLGSLPRIYNYNSSRPAFLSVRLKRSVSSLRPEELARAAREGAAIVVTGERRDQFLAALEKLGFSPGRTILEWDAFGTRKTFLQFARVGASWEDWRAAWRARDLAGLREHCEVLTISPPGGTEEAPARKE